MYSKSAGSSSDSAIELAVGTSGGPVSLLLCVGTELTDGKIGDTHGRYLGAELRRCGAPVRKVVLIPDDAARFSDELRDGCAGFDFVIITGGLGPTSDDLTRDTVARVAGVETVFHDDLWAGIRRRLTGHQIPEANRRQAYIPKGFSVIRNDNGTAPGFYGEVRSAEGRKAVVIALPGPPHELRPMFQAVVPGLVAERYPAVVFDELACTAFLTSESVLEEQLQRCAVGEISWGTRVDESRIAFFLRGGTIASRRSMLGCVAAALGTDRVREGEADAAEIVFSLLRERGARLVAAESCTGGLVTKYLTDLPGSSAVLWGGFVVYSNEAKVTSLGVSSETLGRFGAVSEETVREMADGALARTGVEYAVSISGVAGPDGGTDAKPVGTVWICAAASASSSARSAARDATVPRQSGGATQDSKGTSIAREYHFRGDRSRVRRSAAVAALLLIDELVRAQGPA